MTKGRKARRARKTKPPPPPTPSLLAQGLDPPLIAAHAFFSKYAKPAHFTLRRMVTKCTNIYNARAQPLLCLSILCLVAFSVAVAVVLCISSPITFANLQYNISRRKRSRVWPQWLSKFSKALSQSFYCSFVDQTLLILRQKKYTRQQELASLLKHKT